MKLKLRGALALLSLLPACSNHDNSAMSSEARGSRWTDSSAGTVVLGLGAGRAYRAGPVEAHGTIMGGVTARAAAGDSVARVTKESRSCSDSATVRPTSRTGASLPNALVWVDGIAAGKALPEVRRETLVVEDCRFEPRILAVVARSTINVLSRDRVEHSAQFYREGRGEPVAHVHTVDAGQVVPTETLARAPGIVEGRCALHPWERSYIAVFDHPYFAVTDEQGAFRIDSLPPGTYTVKAWREGLSAPIEQRVVVQPSGASRVDLTVALGP